MSGRAHSGTWSGDPGAPQWHHLSDAERAQAYSPSSKVGDLGPFIAAYRDHSAQAYATLDVITLSYGDRPSQTVDVALPKTSMPAPLHVFVHGGYWQELSKRESFFAAYGTLEQGIGFAAIDYTLAPDATLAEIVAEVVAALRMLGAKAATLGLDPGRMVVSGSSAGAHLAAMASLEMAPEEQPAGLILLSGIYDLRPLVGTYINDPLGLDLKEAARLSPALHDVPSFPPTLVAWGEVETAEFKRQSRWFADILSHAGTEVATLEIPGRNHFDIPHDLANDSALGAWLPRLT